MRLMKHVCCFLLLVIATPALATLPALDGEGNALPSLAPLVEKVNPAVVNISTFTTRPAQQNPLLQDPFFRRFFPDGERSPAPARKRARSAGSGVIIDADEGIVVSNHHVVNQADEIHVALNDGRSYKAELLGSDPDVDVAVLKLKDFKKLTAIDFADSDRLRQGDFVVAIGNPFGLGHTVTHGIVSAMGRSGLGIEGYENFIQTDASINPGNSGGALINLKGELVGINTAIFAPSGGNIGIGFAIPANMARASIEQILEYGEVRRGVLGVVIQDLTPELAEVFELEENQQGVIIADVQEDSAAQKAGLKAGDVVTEVDGKKMQSAAQLRNAIGQRRIGDEIDLRIVRDGRSKTIETEIGEPQQLAATSGHPFFEGVHFEQKEQLEGLLVTAIEPNSPGAATGLRPGDVLVSFNRVPIRTIKDLQATTRLKTDRVVLRVRRGNAAMYIVIQ